MSNCINKKIFEAISDPESIKNGEVVHEEETSNAVVARLPETCDAFFDFTQATINSVKSYAVEKLNLEIDKVFIITCCEHDVVNSETQLNGEHSSSCSHHLQIIRDGDELVAKLLLSTKVYMGKW